jgi:hypothetical protein
MPNALPAICCRKIAEQPDNSMPVTPFPKLRYNRVSRCLYCFIIESSNLLRLGLELLLDLATGLDALQDGLTVLVKLELGDDDLGGVDAERDGLSRGLLADNTLDVNDVLETVDGGDLALTTLVGATNDGDLVILADWDRAHLTSTVR